MRIICLLIVLTALPSILLVCGHQKITASGSYWTAELLQLQFGVENVGDHTPWQGTTTAQVYQNAAGIVRHEWISSFPSGHIIRPARDFHIFDYPRGIFMGFNKGERQAVKIEMPEVDKNPFLPQSDPIPEVEIQGYHCRGVSNRLHDVKNKIIETRQTWMAVELDFKQPLLQIVQLSRDDGTPLLITIRAISNLKRVEKLAASLFEIPAGTQFVDMDHPLPTIGHYL